ncbi:hypothetical protein G7046_g5667 [Stylonectria norvegica]|nr:hypothetical protein G7046_g5667 [Stylonectria norvegica]
MEAITRPVQTRGFYCSICDIAHESAQAQREHAKSEWHIYKLRLKHAPPGTKVYSPTDVVVNSDDDDSPVDEANNSASSDEESDSDADSSDDDEEDATPDFIPEQCIFCSHTSGSFDDSVAHMKSAHSLAIPYQDSLSVELVTLIWYLHLVTTGYHECVLCGKRRRSLEAVQQHMTAKGHCRFEITEEMKEFYNLPESYTVADWQQPDKDSLKLPSGKLLSHRSQTASAAKPRTGNSEPQKQRITQFKASKGSSEVMAPKARKEDAIATQLSKLSVNDQRSMMNLPLSQQRNLLAQRKKRLDEARRADRRMRTRVERGGNKTLQKHFQMDGTGRLAAKAGYFDSKNCVDPSGFESCYEAAEKYRSDCFSKNCHGGDRDCENNCNCVLSLAALDCAGQSCWNQVYSCEYQSTVEDITIYCTNPQLNEIPFYPPPDDAPGGCSCNMGKILVSQYRTNNELQTCGSKLDQLSNPDDVQENAQACQCCADSAWLSVFYDVCPDTDPSLLGIDVWYGGVIDKDQWSTCGDYIDEDTCSSQLNYTLPGGDKGNKFYSAGDLPANGTKTLSNIGGVITSPVSGAAYTWTFDGVDHAVTVASADAKPTATATTTGSAKGGTSKDSGDDKKANEGSEDEDKEDSAAMVVPRLLFLALPVVAALVALLPSRRQQQLSCWTHLSLRMTSPTFHISTRLKSRRYITMTQQSEQSQQTPHQLASSLTEDDLKDIVDQQPARDTAGGQVTGLAYPYEHPTVYIKYGQNAYSLRDSEARTQQYAYEALRRIPPDDRQGIYIPEIYRIVYVGGWTYIIMEYVRGQTLAALMEDWPSFVKISQPYYDKIRAALLLLLSFPVPEDATPGPYGGGLIRHPLFKYYRASIKYDSVDMLEKHMNKVATMIRNTAPTVRLERELRFVFADLYEGNFMFTDAGDLYVIDFEQASFLPLSFMSYAMIQHHDVCGALEGKLDLPQENIPAMRHICGLLVMSVPTIGLPL